MARFERWVDGAFSLLYALLFFEIAFELVGASRGTAFHRFTEWASAPFFAPFAERMGGTDAEPNRLVFSYLMGLLAYSVLHITTQGLLASLLPTRVVPDWSTRTR
jgi:hypothetical protein